MSAPCTWCTTASCVRSTPWLSDAMSDPFSQCAHLLQVFYSASMLCGKTAILLDWIRIFSPRGTRNLFFWCSVVVILLNALLYSAALIALNLACSPLEKLWHFWLSGSCTDRRALDLTTSSLNLVFDLSIFLLPLRSIWKLQMPMKRKIGIGFIFSIGVLYVVFPTTAGDRCTNQALRHHRACLGAVGRIITTNMTDYFGERTYIASAIMLVGVIELTCMILIFCVPSIPKIFVESTIISRMRSYMRSWSPLSRDSHDNESAIHLSAQKAQHDAVSHNTGDEEARHSITQPQGLDPTMVRPGLEGGRILCVTEVQANFAASNGPRPNHNYKSQPEW